MHVIRGLQMKVFLSKRAPNPRRVAWVLAEKGANDVEIVDVDILKGEHKTEAYLDVVGVANVPALQMNNGVTITELIAICRYLEAIYPEPDLFGRTPEEVAIVEMWTRRAEMWLATPLMLTVRHSHPALAALEQQSAEVAQANRATAVRSLGAFERRLAQSPFIARDRISIADIVAFIGFDFARMARFSIPDDMPHLQRWAEAMRTRPAAQAGV